MAEKNARAGHRWALASASAVEHTALSPGAVAIADKYTVLSRASPPKFPLDILALPAPVQWQPYVGCIVAAGGQPPYRYAIASATSLNNWRIDAATGQITGTPEVSEADLITVQVTDASASTKSAIFVLTVLSARHDRDRSNVSLRPDSFGEIPATISGTSVGLRGPNDTASAGQRRVNPNSNYRNVVHITSANAPNGQYTCSEANTHYVLQTDLTSDSWCIKIAADAILIDLNGHTLTYLNKNLTPTGTYNIDAAGIFASGYDLSLTQIEVVNGTIQTGDGAIVGDLPKEWGYYGYGANPFRTEAISGLPVFQLRGLYIKWNAYSSSGVAGHNTSYEHGLIEYCTFEDYGSLVASRELNVWGVDTHVWGTIRNCRFVAMRQGAIGAARTAYGNEIWVDGWWTNSVGIAIGREVKDVHNNNVYITGCHPQCMFLTGTKGVAVRENWLEAMYTRVGNQVPSPSNGLDDPENYAVGLTWRYSNDVGVRFAGNTILTHARAATVVNPTNRQRHNSTAKGLWYAKQSNSINTDNAVTANCVMAESADDIANCWALSMGGPASGLTVTGNRFITNRNMFYMADVYEYYEGLTGDPVLSGNSFELVGGRSQITVITNGAGKTFGAPITSAAVEGGIVTIRFPTQGASPYEQGTSVTVAGITDATGFNGTFSIVSCSIVPGGASMITYLAPASGVPSFANATITLPVQVRVVFAGNRWIGGLWAGDSQPSSFTLTGGEGESGLQPVSHHGLNAGTHIKFLNEPTRVE